MGCCGSTLHVSTDRELEASGRAVQEAHWELADRPRRTGKWFIVHRDQLETTQHAGVCEVWEEFFSIHPNGLSMMEEFVAVELDDAQIQSQSSTIVLSSYQWRETRGIRNNDGKLILKIPKNYGGFLSFIQERHLIGWLDIVAVHGVNAKESSVRHYASKLYSELSVAAAPDLLRGNVAEEWTIQLPAHASRVAKGSEVHSKWMRAIGDRALPRSGGGTAADLIEIVKSGRKVEFATQIPSGSSTPMPSLREENEDEEGADFTPPMLRPHATSHSTSPTKSRSVSRSSSPSAFRLSPGTQSPPPTHEHSNGKSGHQRITLNVDLHAAGEVL